MLHYRPEQPNNEFNKFKNVTKVRHNNILSVLWLKVKKKKKNKELSIASLQSLASDE